jgi:hypothetical protein
MCESSCSNCDGKCASQGGAAKQEKDSCRSCPNRQRCHGRSPDITQETVMRLVRDAVLEVLKERGL